MSTNLVDEIKQRIREVPNFPIAGILFYDITPVLDDGPAFTRIIDHYKDRYTGADIRHIIGIESRGFIFGAALAHSLNIGFVPIRKPGKLPWQTKRLDYALEYGTDAIEIHEDAVQPGEKVVIIDDLLATGGTAAAAVQLVEELGATIHETAFVIELSQLHGRDKLGERPIYSLITY